MNWFDKFSEFSWFTIAILVVALAGGILAAVKKDKAKPIMIAAGVIELGLIVWLLYYYINLKDASGTVFGDIGVSSTWYAVLVVALVVVMLAVMIISGRKEKWTARDIANAAMCVAMSFILSCIKLYEMPQGGTITPASLLPMMLYIAAFGPARGLVVGFAYGILQLIQGAFVIHPVQLLMDYPMAFGALALGGLVNYVKLPEVMKLPVAVVLGYIGRYIMAVLSGSIFFAEYAGEQNAWIYSLIYNITYLGPDCAVCAAVALIPGFSRLTKVLKQRV